jgi:predicted  nucleic acid-binding Zn-ribbon protein
MAENQKQLGRNYRWTSDDQDELEKLRVEINNLKYELEQLKLKLDNSITELTNKIDALQNDLDDKYLKINNTIEHLQIEIDRIGTRIGNIEIQIDSITNDITEVKADLTEIKTAIENLKTDITNVKNDITTVKNDITSLKTDISNLQTDLETETKNREDGDNAINKRFSKMYLLKWLRQAEFGASGDEPKISLNDEAQTVKYDFPQEYHYGRFWLITTRAYISSAIYTIDLESIGITLEIEVTEDDLTQHAVLVVTYDPTKNTLADAKKGNTLILDVLYTQSYTPDPDPMPF